MTTPTKPLPKIAIKDNKIYREVDRGLFAGWEEVHGYVIVEPSKMQTVWKGGMIPWKLWNEVCAFLRWSQKTHKCEALMTFFYNKTTREWAAWPFPQHPVGMTVKYETDLELYKEDRKKFGNEWLQMGSIHHHCTSSAFQSTVDTADEEDRDGIHITLGDMHERKMSIHLRQVFEEVQTDAHPFRWIEMPQQFNCLGVDLMYEFFSKAVVYAGLDGNDTFPEEWKSRIIEKKSTLHLTPRAGSSHHFPPQGAKSDAAGGGTATTSQTLAAGKSWREDRKEVITKILERLGISATKAYMLIHEPTITTMSDENRQLRTKLREELDDNLVPPIWSGDLLEEMSTEEIASTYNPGV